MSFLNTSIVYLKGVGTNRAEMLQKELGIFTLSDLLFHFPYRHVDRSQIYRISDIRPDMPYIQLKGKVTHFRTLGQKRAQRLVANFSDGTGTIELVWFQGAKWIQEAVKEGREYMVFGKPSLFNGNYNMPHPTIDEPDTEGKKYMHIMPFYNVTERMRTRGVDSKVLMKLVNTLLTDARFDVVGSFHDGIADVVFRDINLYVNSRGQLLPIIEKK